MADTSLLEIELVYAAAPAQVRSEVLRVPAGSTLAQALACSTLAQQPDVQQLLQQWDTAPAAPTAQQTARSKDNPVSIWGLKAQRHTVLRAHDRIEICRPLLVDPKAARRERFAQQGSKAAGLFARRRAGGKPGY